MRRMPWRSLLLWAFPLVAFAWLAVAAHAASCRPAMPPAASLLGGAAAAPHAESAGLHFTTVSMTKDGKSVRFYGDWNGTCDGYNGAVTASFYQQVDIK